MSNITLGTLAQELNAELKGDPDHVISGLGTLQNAQSHQLTFLANPRYRPLLASTRAGAVLMRLQDCGDYTGPALFVANPYVAFATLSHRFDSTPTLPAGIHPSAIIAESAEIPASACIGALAVIGEGVVIGEGSVIEAGAVVHDRVRIGAHCRLRSRVVIYHDCVLGDRVNIHAGTVIGGDGFGFANERGVWRKIAQIGRVVIGDDVDIGANTTIDRGALEDTEIHNGVIIDNQVQIAHNVVIGAHTAIAACSGISGSTRIGRHCILAGGVGIVGHIEICDGVQITGMTMITKSISEPGSYSSGTAFDSTDNWKKMAVRLRRIDELAQRVKALEKS
ncbi:MAG: UDP-3-O-(3-hydroxymyristoyl)glucosamine N-acyltransferase [Pseudomonadota bacterium]